METAPQGSTAEAISTIDAAMRTYWLKDATCISDARVDHDDDYVILELRHDPAAAELIWTCASCRADNPYGTAGRLRSDARAHSLRNIHQERRSSQIHDAA